MKSSRFGLPLLQLRKYLLRPLGIYLLRTLIPLTAALNSPRVHTLPFFPLFPVVLRKISSTNNIICTAEHENTLKRYWKDFVVAQIIQMYNNLSEFVFASIFVLGK